MWQKGLTPKKKKYSKNSKVYILLNKNVVITINLLFQC